MTNLTRRSFVGQATVGLAAFGAMTPVANAQLVDKVADWKIADFDRLIKNSSRVKQVYDEIQIGASIRALQSRGIQLLCCHTATEEQSRVLIKQNNLAQQPEEIVKDMLSHTLPGVLVVASMVAAIALLQSEGHYSYITV